MKCGNFYSPYLAYNYKHIRKKLCKLRTRVLISLNYCCIELSYFVIVDENYKLKCSKCGLSSRNELKIRQGGCPWAFALSGARVHCVKNCQIWSKVPQCPRHSKMAWKLRWFPKHSIIRVHCLQFIATFLWLLIGLPGGYTVGKLGKNGNLGAWKILSLNVQPFCTTE